MLGKRFRLKLWKRPQVTWVRDSTENGGLETKKVQIFCFQEPDTICMCSAQWSEVRDSCYLSDAAFTGRAPHQRTNAAWTCRYTSCTIHNSTGFWSTVHTHREVVAMLPRDLVRGTNDFNYSDHLPLLAISNIATISENFETFYTTRCGRYVWNSYNKWSSCG